MSAPLVLAQERSLVVTEGADYFGADYDIRKDVDLEACKAACLEDGQCRSFTYNQSAGWCFLKEDVGELRAVQGAVSGRILLAAEAQPDVEAERVSQLGFLPQSYVDTARRFVGQLDQATGFDGGLTRTLEVADAAAARGELLRASDLYRGALRLAPERLDVWMRYTDVALRASHDDWQVQRRLRDDRVSGAVNAFLRAVDIDDQAHALQLIGTALANRDDWKPAIRAYRASLALREDAGVRETYDGMLAAHGFRIVDHAVDADAAAPRICLNFSDTLATARADLADFVSVEGGGNLAVEASGEAICIDGVEHGRRYRVTAREGLPSADGEVLAKSAELDIFVRDRAPAVRFLGNAYILPAGGEPTIPVVTVNASRVNATLYRIGDRQMARAIADGNFLSQLSSWEAETIEDSSGEKVWSGTVEVARETNREITTAVPVGAMQAQLEPGAYILTAEALNAGDDEWMPKATQWFVVTDLGLTTLAGNDGLHVMVRSLGSAEPVDGVRLRLIATNNEILGEATTDAAGYALFAPGLMRGTGGMAPQLLSADTSGGEYSFIDLAGAPMDLADRGVEGRAPPKPLDVFLTTERGIYRVGETVHATALVRDATAMAAPGVPLTQMVVRPDGKEHSRTRIADQGLGGSVTPFVLPANAMRGTWRVGVYADADAEPLAEASFLVEDFDPERLDFDVEAPAEALDPAASATIEVAARFLYGAPASDLKVEGETVLRPVRRVAAYPGYVFGLEEEPFNTSAEPFAAATTDADGHAELALALPDSALSSRPLEATINVRVLDSGDRPVERNVTLPVLATKDRLAVKPLFEGAAAENGPVAFEAIAVDPQAARVSVPAADWTLYKVRTAFQWYRADGRWNYETVTHRSRVASGTLALAADRPARIEAQVDWGTYELELSAADALPVSYAFEAGWYVEPKALDTPEALKISLDKPGYSVGESARVHIESRFDGIAALLVVDDRLIATRSVRVTGGSADIDLPVTRDWGPGAYVTAVLYRPMDIAAKRMPGRAIGLAWAGVDPAGRDLDVSLQAPATMRPRQDMPVELTLAGLPAGSEAYVTLAAVDLGILNLTRYQTPDPEAWYFGQRRLGMGIRDIYNQLIDRMQGVRGTVRSGGDAGPVAMAGPAPTEALLAFHSGTVRVGDDGRARISVPVSDFNGTVRLMAMAWTRDGVGHAEADVLVRDPVVVTASLPHFLAPGDQSRLSLDLDPVDGVAGAAQLSVQTSGDAVSVDATAAARTLDLQAGRRSKVLVPISAEQVGDDVLTVTLTLPDGERLAKTLDISVRMNEPQVVTASFVEIAPGSTLSVTPEALAGLVPGTASVQVSASGAGRLNVPAILRALDRYPYGCTEQIASRAMPLVYLNDVALRAGLAGDPDVRERVQKAVVSVLANQSASGSFGLWSPGGDDLWLDSYVADFLTRARQQGFDVPGEGFDLALANLKNKLAYAGDFESGGEALAYALYVLAANSRASIGDLRYYVETKLDDFITPLAQAQLGAALALYGDKVRAETAFRSALSMLEGETDAAYRWRTDYGSTLRDGAAILTLASETRTGIDFVSLSRRVEADRQKALYTSTQDDAWSLLAAHALMESVAAPDLVVDGSRQTEPLFRGLDAAGLAADPLDIENRGSRPVDIGLTVRGVPQSPEPAGGNYYRLTRSYFTLEGEPVDLATIAQGDRLVAVLDVTTTESTGARLILDDPLPAGFEIDNPHLLRSGDVAALDWLKTVEQPAHVEFRADRFIAAFDLARGNATQFQFAYMVRAISPGEFLHPAALVEDMYRPERRGRTAQGRVEVVGPLR